MVPGAVHRCGAFRYLPLSGRLLKSGPIMAPDNGERDVAARCVPEARFRKVKGVVGEIDGASDSG